MQAFNAAANFLGGKYLKDCILYVTLESVRCVLMALTQIGKLYMVLQIHSEALWIWIHNCILKILLLVVF